MVSVTNKSYHIVNVVDLDYLVWKPNTLFSIFKTSFWQTL